MSKSKDGQKQKFKDIRPEIDTWINGKRMKDLAEKL